MSSTAADYVFSVRRRAVSEPVQPILQQGMRAGDVHLKETAAIAAGSVSRGKDVYKRQILRFL